MGRRISRASERERERVDREKVNSQKVPTGVKREKGK